jgi:hypothetical protein
VEAVKGAIQLLFTNYDILFAERHLAQGTQDLEKTRQEYLSQGAGTAEVRCSVRLQPREKNTLQFQWFMADSSAQNFNFAQKRQIWQISLE